jgi:GNAT superfamily N-acetyltransferase
MKSIRSKIKKAQSQGFARTLEVQFNRFVPPWVFRYSKGDIYDLSIEKLKSLGEKSQEDEGLVAKCLEPNADERLRLQLREFTWNSVPIETTGDDIGYAICDAEEPGKLLAGLWAAPESFLENNLGVKFEFAQEQAWLYCAFVHADARGRGVYKKLISFAAADLQDRGFTQLLGIVQPWNRISRLMHENQSRGIIGRMSAIRIGSLVWISKAGNLEVSRRLVASPRNEPTVVSIATQCWRPVGESFSQRSQSPSFGRSKAANPQ